MGTFAADLLRWHGVVFVSSVLLVSSTRGRDPGLNAPDSAQDSPQLYGRLPKVTHTLCSLQFRWPSSSLPYSRVSPNFQAPFQPSSARGGSSDNAANCADPRQSWRCTQNTATSSESRPTTSQSTTLLLHLKYTLTKPGWPRASSTMPSCKFGLWCLLRGTSAFTSERGSSSTRHSLRELYQSLSRV